MNNIMLERLVGNVASRLHNNESHLLHAQSCMLVVLQWRTEQGEINVLSHTYQYP